MPEPGRGRGETRATVAAVAEEFGVAMYRVAIAVVRDPALAEDVVQDALLKVWDGLDGFRGEAPLRPWVLRITHNTAVSTLRRIRDETWDPAKLPDVAVGGRVEEAVIARDELERLRAAIGELDDLSRAILAMREGQAMSYDEIAESLGITLGQVKIRLFRARRHLKALVTGAS